MQSLPPLVRTAGCAARPASAVFLLLLLSRPQVLLPAVLDCGASGDPDSESSGEGGALLDSPRKSVLPQLRRWWWSSGAAGSPEYCGVRGGDATLLQLPLGSKAVEGCSCSSGGGASPSTSWQPSSVASPVTTAPAAAAKGTAAADFGGVSCRPPAASSPGGEAGAWPAEGALAQAALGEPLGTPVLLVRRRSGLLPQSLPLLRAAGAVLAGGAVGGAGVQLRGGVPPLLPVEMPRSPAGECDDDDDCGPLVVGPLSGVADMAACRHH